jgi:hypothetical protein
MCSPATCRNCSKTTWSGCGAHVDQVMRRVPQQQRCDCDEAERAPGGGLLSRLLGR